MSVKQFSWIIAYTRFHPECGDDIVNFFKDQLKKSENIDQFIEAVGDTLRKHYTNDYNQEFIESVINTLKGLEI